MRTKILSSFALVAAVALFACGSDSGADDSVDNESEQELSAAAAQIAGAWHVADDDTLDAFVFHKDGTFVHDQERILNGVLIPGGPPPGRDIGTYRVSARNKTITLHVTTGWHAGSTSVYAYKYTPAQILNGIYIPGHEPGAKLDLTLQPAPRSHVAYPTVTYKHRDSWCNGLPNIADNDCAVQKREGTWVPDDRKRATCDVATNACFTR